MQIVEGELKLTADYVSRAVTAEGADRVIVTVDAFLPAGSTATVEIGVSGAFVPVAVSAAVPLGDGVVEQTFQRKPYEPLDARARIRLDRHAGGLAAALQAAHDHHGDLTP